MSMPRPYGTWPSPLSASALVSASVGLGGVRVDGGDIYWLELRPQEGGRTVLVRLDADGIVRDVTAAGTNVRSRVHEYGGGAYCVDAGEVFYTEFADQCVYRLPAGGRSAALTAGVRVRHADFIVDRPRRRLIAVQEDHRSGGEPVNSLVALSIDAVQDEGRTLAAGHDFYSSPRVSPDGHWMSWLAWRHPAMPWDGTELWVARVTGTGDLSRPRCVAGGPSESVFQPEWSPDGSLYFVSDRDGWWRFYVLQAGELDSASPGTPPLLRTPPAATEFGRPQWLLGMRTWAFLTASTLVATFSRHGHTGLAIIDVTQGTCRDVATDVEPLDDVAVLGGDVLTVAGSATRLPAVVRVSPASGAFTMLRTSASVDLDEAYLSRPEAIEYPTDGGETAHAFYYAPVNPTSRAPDGERPPLMVIIHSGPTDAAKPVLRMATQYWTSRGFAVVDVNYGGSTGFGRAYRERLNGQWGVADVADCVNAARWLVAHGKADPERLIIRGGSAGGYTALAAIATYPGVFGAAASHYGICDLEVLAADTHKFESRYTDTLIGAPPQTREIYRARSPIHAVGRVSCPLIIFHGADDKVVPLNQAHMMADALKRKGLPVALIVFEGEQHGFRKASSVVRALEAELWFYGAVFGFRPADAIDPVAVDNLRPAAYRPPSSA